MSSFTQPPVYVLALDALIARGLKPDPWILDAAEDALDWLWTQRMNNGLITIVHPWESGADISPRFDDWYGTISFDRLHQQYDDLVETAEYDPAGVAVSNPGFVAAPVAFNAIAVDAAARLSEMRSSDKWKQRATALSRAIDDQLWDEKEALWRDRADAPERQTWNSINIPTLDGVLGALATDSRELAEGALIQCIARGRFAAPYGPRYLPQDHLSYNPDAYWRGPTWPQLNYLLVTAARTHGLYEIADELVSATARGVWQSGFSEYWNPETGEARGATPQSWATVAVALMD